MTKYGFGLGEQARVEWKNDPEGVSLHASSGQPSLYRLPLLLLLVLRLWSVDVRLCRSQLLGCALPEEVAHVEGLCSCGAVDLEGELLAVRVRRRPPSEAYEAVPEAGDGGEEVDRVRLQRAVDCADEGAGVVPHKLEARRLPVHHLPPPPQKNKIKIGN